tara:strand:+ start:1187 stop:2398 length:1212 start_codon:yes stop_codon:yes gene_type:complete
MSILNQIIFILLLSVSFSLSAKVVAVNVQAKGFGNTYDMAVKDALSNAVSKVTGVKIATATIAENVSVKSGNSNGKSSQMNAQSIASATATLVSGTVESYKVTKQSQDKKGLYSVRVEAQIYKFQDSKSSKRKKIALLETSFDKSSYYFMRAFKGFELANEINKSLEQFIVQSRKFAILTRQDLDKIQSELSIIGSNATPVKEKAKIGQMSGADLLLISELVHAEAKSSKTTSSITGQTSSSIVGSLKLRLRVIDTVSSEVKFSDKYEVNAKDYSSFDGAVTAISKLAINDLVTRIYPHIIIDVTGSTLLFNAGGDGVKKGESYLVYKLGDKLFDPYTKESLGREESQVGEITVTRVEPKVSYATIEKGTAIEKGMLLRKKIVTQNKKPDYKHKKVKGISLNF